MKNQLQQTLLALAVCFMSMNLAAADNSPKTILSSAGDIQIAPAVAAGLAIVLGTIVAVAGYKLLRPVIFVCGFLAGGIITSLIIEKAFDSYSWMDVASWIGFVVGGFIIGTLAAVLYPVGVFIVGMVGGIILAFMLNSSFGYLIYPSHPDVILIIFIVVLAVLGGILTLFLEKPILIVATSWIGASALVWGIGYFAGDYPSGSNIKHYYREARDGNFHYHIPDAWWAYLAATVVAFALAMFIQFRKTAREVEHRRARAPREENDFTENVSPA